MKIKVLEYKIDRGNKVRVQSHNFRKGKWIKNLNWEIHQRASVSPLTLWRKEYSTEIKEGRD